MTTDGLKLIGRTQWIGEDHGSEDPPLHMQRWPAKATPLRKPGRELNAETLREEKSGGGEGDVVVNEPNIKYYSTSSYQLSIECLFTELVIRTGRRGFELWRRKSRDLRELETLRRFGETVGICGKFKGRNDRGGRAHPRVKALPPARD